MKRKWNWVDTLVAAIIILIVVTFINRNKIIGGSSSNSSNTVDIIITVEASELTEDMISDLEKGDQFYAQYSLQNAYISDFEIMPKQEITVGKDGKIRVYDSKDEISVNVEIEAKAVTSGPYMELGGQEIKVGVPIIVKTTEVEFPGEIKHIEVK